MSANEPFNQESTIAEYKSLIRQMPQANQYLLLYVLDLLSVFSRKSDKNLMNAQSASSYHRSTPSQLTAVAPQISQSFSDPVFYHILHTRCYRQSMR